MPWTNPWEYNLEDVGPENESSFTDDTASDNVHARDQRGAPSMEQRILQWRREVNRGMRWLMFRRAAMRYIRRCFPCFSL
eukprot:8025114-Prorocentrum_lima.AAC.1